MAFIGKLAYLALFPGFLFILLAGTIARGVLASMSSAMAGGATRTHSFGLPDLFLGIAGQFVQMDGAARTIQWLAPVVKIFTLSWISCILFGFLAGDLLLLYTLLLLAALIDILMCITSVNPRVKQNFWPEVVSMLAWAVPLAFIIAGISLRTGEVTVKGLIRWQAVNGILLGSSAGGALAQAGTALALAAAFICISALIKLRPLGRSYFSDTPSALTTDLSGPPLAVLKSTDSAMLLLGPLILVALFFAGPALTWYEVLFWILKVIGITVLLGLVDMLWARSRTERIVLWTICTSSLAFAGLLLVLAGVSR